MIENFVTYEIAKKLEDIGFDEFCHFPFNENGELCQNEKVLHNITNDRYDFLIFDKKSIHYMGVRAPIWQQVQKWLREKHQIYIEVLTDCTTEPKFCFKIDKFVGNPEDLTEREWDWIHHTDFEWFLYYTYEKALEEAIKEAIKII